MNVKELRQQFEKEGEDNSKTFCSLCIHYVDNMRKNGTQSKCSKFNEVCCEVNNNGNCRRFTPQTK